MSFLTGNIKSILTVKIKVRHDSYTDQVSRIFVAKIFLVESLVMGLDWFHDNISCTEPRNTPLNSKYINSACWIQGFYIFPKMEEFMDESAHYGIPKYIEVDGTWKGNGHLCKSKEKLHGKNEECHTMQRHYFAQYQWMPFYVASLAILFYLPYIIFRIANTDLISLREHLKKHSKIDIEDIIHNYFDYQINSQQKMRLRIGINLLIKILYVFVNISVFAIINATLRHKFTSYGIDWIKWVHHNESMNFAAYRLPTPGNQMLPTFGFCDIHDASLDSEKAYENVNKLICEISSNMLYQYVFLVIWFVLIISISVSCLGVILNIFAHLMSVACLVKNDTASKYVYRYLTLRECEYLELIRRKNLALYGKVVRTLWFIKDEEINKRKTDESQLESPNLEQGNCQGTAPLLKLGTDPLLKLTTLPLKLGGHFMISEEQHKNQKSIR